MNYLRIGLLALLVGYPLAVTSSGPFAMYADASVFAIVITSAALACWFAYRRAAPPERRFWLLLVAINLLTMVSQIWYAAYLFGLENPEPPVPSFADLLNFAAAGCFIALGTYVIRKRVWTRSAAIRHVLDAASLAVIAYAALALGYVAPVFTAAGPTDTAFIATGAAYPLFGLLIGVVTVMTVLGKQGRLWHPWEKLVSASLGVYALGLLAWPVFRVTADYVALNTSAILYSLVFLSGHYLMFAAAVVRLSYAEAWTIRMDGGRRPRQHAVLALIVPALALVAVLGLAHFVRQAPAGDIVAPIALACAIALLILLAARSSAVMHENAQLQELAVTDPLTGLLDRRQFLVMIAEQIKTAQRYGDPVSLIIMDLDALAALNSRLGNYSGDQFLRACAQTIVSYARPGDTAFRAGDDEFALLMPDCTAADAMNLAERLRIAVAAIDTGSAPQVTASIGVAVFPEDALDHHFLLRRAESSAYYAKTHGKNQVTRFDATREFDLGPKERAERLQMESRLSTVRALAAAVDARDSATQYHSRNVARLCVVLGSELGLSRQHVELVETAALLHDIGKIGVSDVILRKAGRLTPAERAEVQQHVVLSERILGGTNLKEILPWILSHHERWDGAGYPAGLVGAQIPFEARILAVCDAYDAMTSDRPYRSALSPVAALQEMDLNMGTQFDPEVVEAFIRVIGRAQTTQGALDPGARSSAS